MSNPIYVILFGVVCCILFDGGQIRRDRTIVCHIIRRCSLHIQLVFFMISAIKYCKYPFVRLSCIFFYTFFSQQSHSHVNNEWVVCNSCMLKQMFLKHVSCISIKVTYFLSMYRQECHTNTLMFHPQVTSCQQKCFIIHDGQTPIIRIIGH